MRGITCVIFLCLALGAQSFIPGEHYDLAQQYVKSLKLGGDSDKDAFNGLDVNGDRTDGLPNKKIDIKDLDTLYWYDEAQFAKAKFLAWLNEKKDAKTISSSDVKKFMEKQSSIQATIECTYVKSTSLREYCFADQLLTYNYLILDKDNVEGFYNKIELDNDADNEIKENDVKALELKGLKDVPNFLEELGGGKDKHIDRAEFMQYVTQEDISDDFRPCRLTVDETTGKATYNEDCLVKELINYTQDDLTEMDIAITYNKIDQNGGGIDANDLVENLDGIDKATADRIILLLDRSKNGNVDYAEFRTYLKKPTVRLQLEKECTEPITNQRDEIVCIKDKLTELLKDLHAPILINTPDLDMLFTYEKIDVTDDGIINPAEDLKGWDKKSRERFVEEIDGPDVDKNIDLEEFIEYVYIPHMVYGIGDCLQHKRKEDCKRVDCYVDELKDVIRDFLSPKEIEEFFSFYNTDKSDKRITDSELAGKFSSEDEVQYFLTELGQGDQTVAEFEFRWYVKQQELADMYNKAGLNHQPATLHGVITDYIDNRMTEYDIVETFFALDVKKDYELEDADWPKVPTWPAVRKSIDAIGEDRDTSVNLMEFWVWLHFRTGSAMRKDKLISCAEKHKKQADEINCYKETILAGKL